MKVYYRDFLSEPMEKNEVSQKERDVHITAEKLERNHSGELNRRLERTIEQRVKRTGISVAVVPNNNVYLRCAGLQ